MLYSLSSFLLLSFFFSPLFLFAVVVAYPSLSLFVFCNYYGCGCRCVVFQQSGKDVTLIIVAVCCFWDYLPIVWLLVFMSSTSGHNLVDPQGMNIFTTHKMLLVRGSLVLLENKAIALAKIFQICFFREPESCIELRF